MPHFLTTGTWENDQHFCCALLLALILADVLSDPQKRQVYEAYGEEGLKTGAPPPSAQGMPGRPPSFSSPGANGGSTHAYTFDSAAAQRLFEQLFGGRGATGIGKMFGGGAGSGEGGRRNVRMFTTNTPGAAGGPSTFVFASGGGGSGSRFAASSGEDEEGGSNARFGGRQPFDYGGSPDDGCSEDPFQRAEQQRFARQRHSAGRQQRQRQVVRAPEPHVVELPLSLEQLCNGKARAGVRTAWRSRHEVHMLWGASSASVVGAGPVLLCWSSMPVQWHAAPLRFLVTLRCTEEASCDAQFA
jgi:curved DNA-binding protein CbpA